MKTVETDFVKQGVEYLGQVRQLMIAPGMIELTNDINLRIQICEWIGQHIQAVNAQLEIYLDTCHGCFHISEQRPVQILAAPIADPFGIDALCNVQTTPMTILMDVGRVAPQDWLSAVAHEYAHAYLGRPGHDEHFSAIITHLCLKLGLPIPKQVPNWEATLPNWPPYESLADPLSFWLGH